MNPALRTDDSIRTEAVPRREWFGVKFVALCVGAGVAVAVLLALTGFIAGIFCAPTLTASVDQLSRIVPEGGRGEAMGCGTAPP
ncbi:hypothetical protein [Nocardia sp. NPDC020380]|uniref:hypothetical protein n=1 Tax=Nocardia sp. NPDC020380 TaxID=3364309 RepID=UPI00379F8C1D